MRAIQCSRIWFFLLVAWSQWDVWDLKWVHFYLVSMQVKFKEMFPHFSVYNCHCPLPCCQKKMITGEHTIPLQDGCKGVIWWYLQFIPYRETIHTRHSKSALSTPYTTNIATSKPHLHMRPSVDKFVVTWLIINQNQNTSQ